MNTDSDSANTRSRKRNRRQRRRSLRRRSRSSQARASDRQRRSHSRSNPPEAPQRRANGYSRRNAYPRQAIVEMQERPISPRTGPPSRRTPPREGPTIHVQGFTPDQVKVLQKEHPGSVVVTRPGDRHGHAVSAYQRRVLGVATLASLFKEYPQGTIIDVGFSLRHRVGRNAYRVHGCERALHPQEHLRIARVRRLHPEDEGPHTDSWSFCAHDVHDCKCVNDIATFFFEQSIYYFTPQKLAELLMSSPNGTGTAVLHVFPEPSGVFYGGEASYVVDQGQVAMQVVGNQCKYTHSDMRWLNNLDAALNLWVSGRRVVLAWKCRTLDSHTMRYDFYAYHGSFTPKKMPVDQIMGHAGELIRPDNCNDVVREMFSVIAPDWASIYHTDKTVTIVRQKKRDIRIPQSVLARAYRFIAGKPINAKTYQGLNSEVRRLLRPEDFKDSTYARDRMALIDTHPYVVQMVIMRLVINGSISLAQFKTFENHKVIEAYNTAREWQYWAPEPEPSCCTPCCWWFGITALLALLGVICVYTGWLLRCLAGGVGLYALLLGAQPVMAGHTAVRNPWDQFRREVYVTRRVPQYPVSAPLGYGLFPGGESSANLADFPLNEAAVIKGPLEMVKSDLVDDMAPPTVVLVGVGFTCRMPVVSTRSHHNLYVGVHTRVLCQVPAPAPGAWKRVEIMDDELDIIPHGGAVVSKAHPHEIATFEDYIARFPGGARRALINELESLDRRGLRTSSFYYSAFIKAEKMMLYSQHEYVPMRPRVIQALSRTAKVVGGPWFLNYTYALKKCWHNRNWLFYCSACTTDDFNQWFAWAHVDLAGDVIYVFTDFSKYDVTQGPEAMARETEHYRDLGLDRVKFGRQLRLAMCNSTVYAKSMRYSVPGTRKSGDSNTSSGNTKATGDCLGSFWKSHGLKGSVRAALLGDDIFMVVRHDAVIKKFGTVDNLKDQLSKWAADLGYKLKIGVTADAIGAEFLSSRFYPVRVGWRFGKKPGRTLVKIGYQLHQQGRDAATYLSNFKGTLQSYLPTSNHVPFLRVYLKVMLEALNRTEASCDKACKYRLTGNVEVADECTWAAFESHYGLGLSDEIQFEKDLRKHIAEYGLTSMMVSEVVERLFEVDFSSL